MNAGEFKPRLLAVGGLVAMASALGIGRFIYTPILPPMTEALGLTKGAAGLIAASNFIGYLVGALLAALPWLQSNPRRWLLTFLALSVASTAAMAWPDAMSAYLALRFVGGAASACVLVLASSLVLDRLNAAGFGTLSSVHFAGVGTGIALSALITWALSCAGYGWRSMWLAGGVASLAGLVVVGALVPDREPARIAAASASVPEPVSSLRLLALAYGLFGFGYVITATFIVAIVRGSPTASIYEPVFWLVLGIAAVPSVALWLAVGRRIGVTKAFAVACLVEAVGVAASVSSSSVAPLVLSSALLGGTFMGITALGLIAARGFAPARARYWVAVSTAAFGLGQIVGPVVAGYGFDFTGSFFLPSMLAVAALCISAVLGFMIGDPPPS